MQLKRKQIYYHLLVLWAVVNIGFAFAASLEENSPFIPYDYVSGQAPSVVLPAQQNFIELHGILDFGKVPKFSLYNTKTQKSVWVKLNDKKAPYFIDSYDPENKMVAITINGVRQQLEISEPVDEGKSTSGPRGPGLTRNFPTHDTKTRWDRNTDTQLGGEEDDEDGEEEDDEEEEEDVEEMSDEEQAQKRREMSERVYKAFQQYVSERRGES